LTIILAISFSVILFYFFAKQQSFYISRRRKDAKVFLFTRKAAETQSFSFIVNVVRLVFVFFLRYLFIFLSDLASLRDILFLILAPLREFIFS
jgi:hypothetical protein